MRMHQLNYLCLTNLTGVAAAAHDTWVETNTSVVRQATLSMSICDWGTMANEHRDFKLASKITPGTM